MTEPACTHCGSGAPSPASKGWFVISQAGTHFFCTLACRKAWYAESHKIN